MVSRDSVDGVGENISGWDEEERGVLQVGFPQSSSSASAVSRQLLGGSLLTSCARRVVERFRQF